MNQTNIFQNENDLEIESAMLAELEADAIEAEKEALGPGDLGELLKSPDVVEAFKPEAAEDVPVAHVAAEVSASDENSVERLSRDVDAQTRRVVGYEAAVKTARQNFENEKSLFASNGKSFPAEKSNKLRDAIDKANRQATEGQKKLAELRARLEAVRLTNEIAAAHANMDRLRAELSAAETDCQEAQQRLDEAKAETTKQEKINREIYGSLATNASAENVKGHGAAKRKLEMLSDVENAISDGLAELQVVRDAARQKLERAETLIGLEKTLADLEGATVARLAAQFAVELESALQPARIAAMLDHKRNLSAQAVEFTKQATAAAATTGVCIDVNAIADSAVQRVSETEFRAALARFGIVPGDLGFDKRSGFFRKFCEEKNIKQETI